MITWLDNDQPWEPIYSVDSQAGITEAAQRALVWGGEVALWSETMDPSNLGSRTWPRAAAIAERFWSDAEATRDADAARPRLEEFRCLLTRRGVAAGTVSGAAVTGGGTCALQHV